MHAGAARRNAGACGTGKSSPELKKLVAGGVLVSRTVKTFGLSEGGLDEMVASLLSSRNPTIGVYAKDDGIHLRITAKADDEETAYGLSSKTWKPASTIYSANISGVRMKTPLKATWASLLQAKGLTLAAMESCSGGLLSHMVTNVPGSSQYFNGGVSLLYQPGQDGQRCRW